MPDQINSTPKGMTSLQFAVECIQYMDMDSLEALLDDQSLYQEFSKNEFLSRLQRVFRVMQEQGNQQLIPFPGQCANCYKGCRGYAFVGDHSRDHVDILLFRGKGKMGDIMECRDFKTDQPLSLGERILIDESYGINLDEDDPF